MQKDKVKGRCQAQADNCKNKKGQGPLSQDHKKSPAWGLSFYFPLFYSFFSTCFLSHLGISVLLSLRWDKKDTSTRLK